MNKQEVYCRDQVELRKWLMQNTGNKEAEYKYHSTAKQKKKNVSLLLQNYGLLCVGLSDKIPEKIDSSGGIKK